MKCILKDPVSEGLLIVTIIHDGYLCRGSYVYPGMIQTPVVTIYNVPYMHSVTLPDWLGHSTYYNSCYTIEGCVHYTTEVDAKIEIIKIQTVRSNWGLRNLMRFTLDSWWRVRYTSMRAFHWNQLLNTSLIISTKVFLYRNNKSAEKDCAPQKGYAPNFNNLWYFPVARVKDEMSGWSYTWRF